MLNKAQRVITDSILGLLTWNESGQILDGKIHLPSSREIDLSIDIQDLAIGDDQDRIVPALVAKARLQIAAAIQREEEFRLAIADQILRHYCEEFQVGPVNHNEISENIGLYRINFFPEEGMNLYYYVSKELEWWKECDVTLVLDKHGEVAEVFWL
jgi:hypothetical protein